MNTPTEEGKIRFPPDGIYDTAPCTCSTAACNRPCKGECGCEACHLSYGDFLSVE